jgi:hypothetical protein
MTLGDLRKFIASIDNIGDEAPIRARVSFRKYLRELTIEDEEPGLQDYLRSMGLDEEPQPEPEREREKTPARSRSRK